SFVRTATPTTELYPLSLHDALPIYTVRGGDTLSGIAQQYGMSWRELAADNGIANPSLIQVGQQIRLNGGGPEQATPVSEPAAERSEEHTSELQSRENLVCRLLLEKK